MMWVAGESGNSAAAAAAAAAASNGLGGSSAAAAAAAAAASQGGQCTSTLHQHCLPVTSFHGLMYMKTSRMHRMLCA